MDQHPTPFPGKTRRSVATSGKPKPEPGKGGGREPSVVASRYNQPQRRVFGTLRSTNAKVEDNITLQKAQHLLAKSGTKPRRPAFVQQPSACLKKQSNDCSPKDTRQQAGSADAKKKPGSVTFREPLPGKGAGGGDGCSPAGDSKEPSGAKKSGAVSFLEPLPGKCAKGSSPTEPKKQAGSSERKKHVSTNNPGSSGKKRPVSAVKLASSGPEVKKASVAAARDPHPLAAVKRRSVESASRNVKAGADEEPRTPAPHLAAAVAKDAAAQTAATPYLSARDCSKCRLDRLETASYWIAQIKLAESSGKHYVAAAFFRLAYQCNAEPFRRLKSELSSYVERHLTVSNVWPEVCRLYGLLEDEAAVTHEPGLTAAEETGKAPAQREATGEDHGVVADVAALLALEGEVMEKSERSGTVVLRNHETVAECCEDCCDRCLVPGATAVEALLRLDDYAVDIPRSVVDAHVQERDNLTGNSPQSFSVIAKISRDIAGGPSEGEFQLEESSEKAIFDFSPSGVGVSPNDEKTLVLTPADIHN